MTQQQQMCGSNCCVAPNIIRNIMKKDEPFNEITFLKTTTDIKFLNEMLSKWIPMSYKQAKIPVDERIAKLQGTTSKKMMEDHIKLTDMLKKNSRNQIKGTK